MKIWNVLFAIPFFLSLCSVTKTNVSNTSNNYLKVDEYLNSVYEETHMPGFSLSITDKDKTIAELQYGNVKDMDNIYFIGSESKSFTALAVSMLASENKIDLDKDIREYIDISISKPVTAKMLLNQTSGFGEYQKLNKAKIKDSTYGKFQYSNENFDTLGKIISSVSNTSYSSYIEDNILKPLGMNNTYADINKIPKDRMGDCYRNYFGAYVKSKPIFPTSNGWFGVPAGYIASTSNDMCKYLRMYLNEGAGVTSKSVINEMVSNRVISDLDGRTSYGYGLFIVNYYGTEIYFHQGLTECVQTYMFIIPSLGIAGEYIFPSYDNFVNTKYVEKVVFNVFNILINRPMKEISSGYVGSHIVYDLLYTLAVALSCFLLVLGVLDVLKKKSKRSIFSVMIASLVYSIVLLLVPVFFGASYFAVIHYVPDLFLTMMLSTSLTIIGFGCAITALLRHYKRG